MIEFAKRNFKEIVRDPISLIFSIGLPLFLLVIFEQFNIPSDVYKIDNFAPSIVIFGFSFITLFTSTLISKDRETSFLTRLFASPLKFYEFILGYILSLIPMALIQELLFFIVASLFGLTLNINILLTIILLIPTTILFISLGILVGSLVNDKASPGISSIIVQLVCFTSGMWFDLSTVSSLYQTICKLLPFKYALDLARDSVVGNYDKLLIPFLIVLAYTIVTITIASYVFKNKMQNDNK